MPSNEITIKSEKIYEGKILNLRVDTVELPNRKYTKKEIVEHSPSVAIVAINDKNEILLVKQFRKAINKELLEIPAGILEFDENPKKAALRELKEETGYHAKNIEYITETYSSPGFCNEKIYIFFASDLIKEEQHLDTTEFIKVENLAFNEAIEMIKLGEISDSKTIIGILLYNQIEKENKREKKC